MSEATRSEEARGSEIAQLMSKHCIPLFERLEIESQSICNRSCWFCPRTYDKSGTYLDERGKSVINEMPTEKILDLLDQAHALGFSGQVTFYFYSEPLLDRRNPMLAREARKRGMRPFMHTNGDVLKHNDSLCGEVASVYEYIVIGLYDYRNNEELEASKSYWQNRLSGAKLMFSKIGPAKARVAGSMAIPRALVPSDNRMGIPDLTYENAPCSRPLVRMIVRHDGEMCNCCEDLHGDFQLGNVYQSSLEDLWFSKRHIEIVTDLIAGRRDKYSLCRNCPLSPTGPAPPDKKLGFRLRRYSV